LGYSDLILIMGYDESGEWKTKQAIAPDAGNYEFSPAQLSTWTQGGVPHLLFSKDEHFFEYSGWPLHLDRKIDLEGLIDVADSRVADVDNDGVFEILVASNYPMSGIRAHSLTTGALLWQVQQSGGYGGALMITQLDADPALEIGRGGIPSFVVDGATHAIEWEYKDGFGTSLVDGTFGGLTPRFAGLGSRLVMFQSTPWSPLWEIGNLSTNNAVARDIDGDGVDEIIYLEGGVLPGIRVLDVQNQSIRYGFDVVSAGRLAVDDFAGEGHLEMVLSAYPDYTQESSKVMYFLNAADGTLKGSLPAYAAGPYLAGGFVRSQGKTDLIVGSTSGSRLDGAITRIDAKTGMVRWRSEYDDPLLGLTRVFDLRIASIVGQPSPVVIAAGRGDLPGYNRIVAVAADDGRALWNISSNSIPEIPFYANFDAIDVIDADGDSQADAVIACTSEGRLRQFTILDRTQTWISDLLSGECKGFLRAPASGADQFVSIMSTGLFAFDAQTHDSSWSLPAPNAILGASYIASGETGPELALFSPSRIDFYDGSTRSFLRGVALPQNSSLMAIKQAPESSIHELLITLDGRLQVIDGLTGQISERSEYLGRNLGAGNHLVLGSIGPLATVTGLGSDVAVFVHRPQLPPDLIFESSFDASNP
ncbi:MAG: PQQ-binding-like beta-propeller repeat protein, partial [Dokdonella sp.]